MGVVFVPCEYCCETFCDGGIRCNEECSCHWCSMECAKKDGFKITDDEDKETEYEKTCNFCRGEEADDSTLLYWMLLKYSLTREEAVEMWKKDQEK